MNETAPPDKTWLNGILFLLTVLTTCYAGLSWSASFLFFDAAAGADLSSDRGGRSRTRGSSR